MRPPKKLGKTYRFHKAFRQMGDDWNIKSHVIKQLEQFTYLVYGHISKSFVNAVHVKLPHKMVGEDVNSFPSQSTCLAFPAHVSFGAIHPACDPLLLCTSCFVDLYNDNTNLYEDEVQQGSMDEDSTRSPGATVIMWSCPASLVDLLDAGDREADD